MKTEKSCKIDYVLTTTESCAFQVPLEYELCFLDNYGDAATLKARFMENEEKVRISI